MFQELQSLQAFIFWFLVLRQIKIFLFIIFLFLSLLTSVVDLRENL